MIIVQLKGGLGNQLFQYAAGLTLAMHHRVELKVDVSDFAKPDSEKGKIRNFELQNIRLNPAVASEEEVHDLLHGNPAQKYLEKLLPPYKRKIYKEASFSFDPHFLNAGNHIYLKGYRQSEKYFEPIKQKVINQFVLKDHLTNHLSGFLPEIQKNNCVALHIRRGDYVSNAASEYHGLLDQSYYQSAINSIEKKIPKPSFFVFSDSPDWVKKNLVFAGDVEFVSGNVTKNHYEDFHLMSQCSHNIIANSTFSWWAAWLNASPGKTVIAPKRWFNQAKINTRDLFPVGWITV